MWDKVKCTPGIITQRKTNMRVAPVTKLKLSTPDSKSYWYNVVENLETRITKVRRQSSISFPPLSLAPSIKCSASDDNNVDYNLVDGNTQMRNVARELIVRVSPPSPSHNECVRDINPQNLRHVEHINYLKECDISNFQLDFLPEENSEDVGKNGKSEKKKSEQEKNSSKMYPTSLDNNLPPLDKVAQILKISSYVNEFLASTRLRIRSTVVPKKILSPTQTLNSHRDRCTNHTSLDQIFHPINNENCLLETRQFANIDRVEKEDAEYTESGELHEKHVGFEGIDVNSEDAECLRLQRARAPSLGVASAVPSFGKILSSLENSDSTESSSLKDNSIDECRMIQVHNYPQSPRNFLKVPKQKIMMGTDSKNIRTAHRDRFHWNGSNSHLKQGFIESSSTSTELSNVKSPTYRRKFKQWPKQSITHVIRALNRMKRRKRVTTDGNYEIFVPSIHATDLYADNQTSPATDIQEKEEPSTNTTNSSTSSGRSDHEESMKNDFPYDNKINLAPSTLDHINMKANLAPIRTTMELKDVKTGDSTLTIKQNESAILLDAVPEIKAMYARRKNDKCLACLDTSMKILSTGHNKFSIFNQNIASILPVKLQNVIFEGLDNSYETELSSNPVDLPADVDTHESRCPNFQTILSFGNRSRDDSLPISQQNFPIISHSDDTVRVPPISSSDRRIDKSFEKKNVASSKSFVSTLSLTSERSKTISDQDDSDQGIEDTGAADEGGVEQKTKFLAPCHAPLNLRPSLEPLKALCGKKTRSIQSRVASLEKTTDHSCDEVSDDNETPMSITKISDEKENECHAQKSVEEISDVMGQCGNPVDEFKYGSELLMMNGIPPNTSYKRLKAASLILDDIYSQLNIDKNMWDYNPSDSFRPMSPIIPLSEIIKISQNSLNENKNVIETLRILENEYTKRITEKNFANLKSNISNISEIMEMTKRLLALLVDSKQYLNQKYSLSHVDSPSKQKCSINSRQLRKVLPVKSYNLIAPILGLPQWHPKHWSAIKDARKLKTSARTVTAPVRDEKVQGSVSKSEFVTEFDLIVHPPSQRGSGLSGASNKFHEMKRLNPYATFLIKPRRKVFIFNSITTNPTRGDSAMLYPSPALHLTRPIGDHPTWKLVKDTQYDELHPDKSGYKNKILKAVIWRELTKHDLEGYDPEATLKNRAAKVTDKICSDFCQWLRGLGGFSTTINEDILKNMFETDFTAEACKTIQISICEMPVVPAAVAAIRNCPQAGEVEILQRELWRDLRAERKTTNSIGFGTNLPRSLRFVPPKNDVESNWFRCENVPEDLETMNATWNGITHLDSVKGFIKWLERHPDRQLPVALRNVSYSEKNKSDTS